MSAEVGMQGSAALTVSEADTAVAMGSGAVQVLATPRVVALFEQATCAAVEGQLPEGCTTVGTSVSLEHLRPTPVGGHVVAEATLDAIDGRKYSFTVTASDANGLIARGAVTRAIVEIDRFMAKAV